MRNTRSRRYAFTLIELLVVVAIIALLVSILLPSLGRAKELTETIVCANRHRGTAAGFTYYATDFNGVWMAPWDRRDPWPGLTPGTYWTQQWPYTMAHYIMGSGIPNGEILWDAAWQQKGFAGPWWSEDGRHLYPPDYAKDIDDALLMQCPIMVKRGLSANPIWYLTTSLSYFIMGGEKVGGQWQYNTQCYPIPDMMTHHSTTGLVMCLSGILSEGGPNAWCVFKGYPNDPHMDKSNYTFCDGHVETLSLNEVHEYMWESMWQRGQ